MEYTVQKLASLAGVSGRTLRYYDEIGLLKPARTSTTGYRIYGPAQVDRLQQILCYKELGLDLESISRILSQPGADEVEMLRAHRQSLLYQRGRLDLLIHTVEQTIASKERGIPMNDADKFKGLTKALVEKNETAYGKEIRAAYGDDTVDTSNAKLLDMDHTAYKAMQALEQQVLDALDAAFACGNPSGAEAQTLVELHRQWLCCSWGEYSLPAHKGVADLYVADERFAAYYDRGTPGKAAFLRQAVHQVLN